MPDDLPAALNLPNPARVAFPDEAAEESALAMLKVLQERAKEA